MTVIRCRCTVLVTVIYCNMLYCTVLNCTVLNCTISNPKERVDPKLFNRDWFGDAIILSVLPHEFRVCDSIPPHHWKTNRAIPLVAPTLTGIFYFGIHYGSKCHKLSPGKKQVRYSRVF